MKKIFTLLFIGVFTFSFGQSIGIYIEDETTDVSGTVVDLAGGEDIHQNFDVINETGGSLDLVCKRTKLTEVSGTTDYLCWGLDLLSGVCYASSTVGPNNPWTTPDVFTWAASDTGLLAVYYVANGYPGESVFRYYVIEDGSGDILDSVDVRYTSTVGIDEASQLDITVFPNPANNVLNIELEGSDAGSYSVVIHNLIGEIVLDEHVIEGKNVFDVSKLNSGVYFYAINRNGEALETKRLIVK